MTDKKLKKIKTGLLDRGLSITKVMVQSSASMAANSIKNILSDEETKRSSFHALLEAQSAKLAKELGKLKGSLMKVGQMLALYGEHFFPPEVVEALQSLNESSQPLEWESIYPILKKRLGEERLEQLIICADALAAASMGQVHLAQLKSTKELVCIKAQYPGVQDAIDSDVKTLRSLLSMFRLLPKQNQGFEAMFKEIKSMLRQEMDYTRELQATEHMYELLQGQSEYIVPKVYPELSGPKVIVTSYEKGVNIDSAELTAVSQDRRNRIGENFARLFLEELFVMHLVQTDPHFGNYKVRLCENEKDQIILLDFGALRRFSKAFVQKYRLLLTGALRNDAEMVIKGATGVGFLKEDDSDHLKQLFVDISSLAVEPWVHPDDPRANKSLLDEQGRYQWGESDLPSRITRKAADYALSFKFRPPPREVIFLDRKIGGVFIVLQKLNVCFKGFTMIEPYLLEQ